MLPNSWGGPLDRPTIHSGHRSGLFKWHWAEAPAPQKRETFRPSPRRSRRFFHTFLSPDCGGYRTVIAKGALLVPSTATASGTWAPANDCVRMI